MHDPRVGRFLSLDPLAPQYPHNSPYVFSENRVIDGIELEGAEYLWYDEALVEMRTGGLFLKRENFKDVFDRRFNEQVISYKDSQGILNITTNNMIASSDDLYQIARMTEPERFYFLEKESFENNKYNINRDRIKRIDGYYKRSSKGYNVEFTHYAPPAKSIGLGVISAISFGKLLYDTKQDIDYNSNLMQLSAQIVSYTYMDPWTSKMVTRNSIFEKANNDIVSAQKMGLIPNNLTISEKNGLMNIVMFGGNGDEGKKIREMGNKILINVTGDQRAGSSKGRMTSVDDPFSEKTKEENDREKEVEYHNQLMPKVKE